MTRFGNQTLTFTSFQKVGVADELGNYELQEVTNTAPWCRHRPMTFQETVDAELDVATEWWRSTIPVHEYDSTLQNIIMALKPESEFAVAGGVSGGQYQMHGGPRTHPDMDGSPFKTTIVSKKQIG